MNLKKIWNGIPQKHKHMMQELIIYCLIWVYGMVYYAVILTLITVHINPNVLTIPIELVTPILFVYIIYKRHKQP